MPVETLLAPARGAISETEPSEAPIVVQSLYKVFGPRPERASELLGQGLSKAQIFEQTGMAIGVENASFTVHSGEVFVVMGLSGSGKSTLLRMLNRLIEPTSGQVFINGQEVTRMGTKKLIQLRRRETAMVFQSFALMPHMTVRENAAFGLDIAGLSKRERLEKSLAALEQVGLKAYAESYPSELSGGMQQRVGLARALATDPSLMLMDEAFSALDPLIRAEMQDELLKLQSERARTIVFISHDLDEALRIGDRIAIMEEGRIAQIGTPEEILRRPANDFVRSFFRGVDPSAVYKAGDIAKRDQLTLFYHPAQGLYTAFHRLQHHRREFGYVRDRKGHFLGVVSVDSLLREIHRDSSTFVSAFLEGEPLSGEASINEVIGRVSRSAYPLPVVDDEGRYLGCISKDVLLGALSREV